MIYFNFHVKKKKTEKKKKIYTKNRKKVSIDTASNRNAGRTVETPDLRYFNSGLR